MPSCIIDDKAQFLELLVQAFDECKIFFAVDFRTQLGYNFSDAERSEGTGLLIGSLNVFFCWS